MMEHKGYIGRVEFDDEVGIFHGEVINTRDVITFQGSSVVELKTAFRDSVEDYLAFCESRGEAPDKPFSGQFMTRISPDLHRKVNMAASSSGKSLNGWVAEQLMSAIGQIGMVKPHNGKRTRRSSNKKTSKRQALPATKRA